MRLVRNMQRPCGSDTPDGAQPARDGRTYSSSGHRTPKLQNTPDRSRKAKVAEIREMAKRQSLSNSRGGASQYLNRFTVGPQFQFHCGKLGRCELQQSVLPPRRNRQRWIPTKSAHVGRKLFHISETPRTNQIKPTRPDRRSRRRCNEKGDGQSSRLVSTKISQCEHEPLRALRPKKRGSESVIVKVIF